MAVTTTPLTPADSDSESLALLAVPDPDRSMIRKQRCTSAIELLRRWGLGLLDPDFEPNRSASELPKEWWLIETPATPAPEGAQVHFPGILAGARETLDEKTARPMVIHEVAQESSVPKDEVFLNLWYYLSAEGRIVEPKVIRRDGQFVIQLVVTA